MAADKPETTIVIGVPRMKPETVGATRSWMMRILNKGGFSLNLDGGLITHDGLQEAVDSRIQAAMPDCGEGCKLEASLDRAAAGIASHCALSLYCGRISFESEEDAQSQTLKCQETQQAAIDSFSRLVGGEVNAPS